MDVLQPGLNINVTFRQIWVQWFSIDFSLLQRKHPGSLAAAVYVEIYDNKLWFFYDITWTSQHSKALLSHTPRQNEDLCLSAGWEPSNDWSWSSWRHNHLRFFMSGWKTEHRVLLFLLHHLPLLLLLLLLLRVNRVSFLPLSPPLWPAACSWNSPAPLIFNLCAY